MQSQGLALPPKSEVGPSATHVSTKESCIDPLGNDPDTGDSEKYRLCIEENPPRLVALGKLYEVGVEKVRDADAPIPVPTEEVQLVGHAHNTFVAWPTHLVKRLSEQGAMGPAKPADRLDHDVMWDATVFGVFNDNFPLYIKHDDLHMTETNMRAGNSDVHGFLEPQSIQRSGQSQFEPKNYIKNWMQKSKRDVYLAAYLNGAHWQMVIILSKENVVIWFCSLHNRLDNYLKGIINSALKGLDPYSKSKATARWIVVKYFNDARSLEPERLKALRIQWATYYLKVKNKTISV
ncbi:hypothetical protein GmHk_05G013011 [Glycine max]|nr:hypothetical protein GmHk_05G013011 [Glycine max]